MPHLTYNVRTDDPPHTRHATDWLAPLRNELDEARNTLAKAMNNVAGMRAHMWQEAELIGSHLDDLADALLHLINDGGTIHVDRLADLLVKNVRPAQRRLGRLIDAARAES